MSREKFWRWWAIVATILAVVFLNATLFMAYRGYKRNLALSPFLQLKESDVPGRYKWNDGKEEFIITLNPDHTMRNKEGVTYREYRWEILRDGLLLVWQRSVSRFDQIESPGVFTATRKDGTEVRLEKVE